MDTLTPEAAQFAAALIRQQNDTIHYLKAQLDQARAEADILRASVARLRAENRQYHEIVSKGGVK